jgi:glutathione synthase/RimK-type ligase-like ATP-grasp enzyme
MEKNVIVYWCSFRGKKNNILSFLGSKKKVYLDVFDKVSEKANLALVFGGENYLGGLRFKNYYLYENGQFHRKNKIIKADAVLDRSRSTVFPKKTKTLNKKVLNQQAFKQMVGDKWLFYKYYGKYSPETYLCSSGFTLNRALKNFNGTERVVVKPRYGLKGRDIVIGTKEEIKNEKIKYPVVIQKFAETEGSFIKGNRSDVRVVIIDGTPVYALVRVPKEGSLLANVAQGGAIDQVNLDDLPPKLLETSRKIARDIKIKYENPFYSIDFGVTGKGFVIFEMNNFIGFPLITRNHQKFVDSLAEVLLDKANN